MRQQVWNLSSRSAEESFSPLGSAELVPRSVVRTRENLLAAGFIGQNDSKLRTSFCRFQNILIAVALRVEDKSFEFFVYFENIGRNGNAIVVSFAFVFVDDDFHFSSDALDNKLRSTLLRTVCISRSPSL